MTAQIVWRACARYRGQRIWESRSYQTIIGSCAGRGAGVSDSSAMMQMCRAIDAAYALDEVKIIRDQAAMLEAAARVANNVEAETRAYEIRTRASRKAGSLSKKIEKAPAKGNQYTGKVVTPHSADIPTKARVLEKAGISSQQASEWERLSDVPDGDFETALATKSVRDLIDKPTPVEGDALFALRMIGRLLVESAAGDADDFFLSGRS
jgi:hypothetical protein